MPIAFVGAGKLSPGKLGLGKVGLGKLGSCKVGHRGGKPGRNTP